MKKEKYKCIKSIDSYVKDSIYVFHYYTKQHFIISENIKLYYISCDQSFEKISDDIFSLYFEKFDRQHKINSILDEKISNKI